MSLFGLLTWIVSAVILQPVGAGAVQPASGDSMEAPGFGACTVRVVDIDPPAGVLHAFLLPATPDDSAPGPSATRAMRVLAPALAFTLDSIPYGAYTLSLSHDTAGTVADSGSEATMSRDALTWVIDFVLDDSLHQIEAGMRDASPRSATLTVTMTGFRNETGIARVTLFNGAEGFPGKPELALMHGSSPIANGQSQIIFEQLPFGTYGVGVVHDENANERMDTDFLGRPREGYGVSNDARGRFGPPSFEDARFTVDQDAVTITVTLTY